MTGQTVRLGVRDGVELLLVRDRRLWRRWRWVVDDQTLRANVIVGRAWTRREAESIGRAARALRIAGNLERDILRRLAGEVSP